MYRAGDADGQLFVGHQAVYFVATRLHHLGEVVIVHNKFRSTRLQLGQVEQVVQQDDQPGTTGVDTRITTLALTLVLRLQSFEPKNRS